MQSLTTVEAMTVLGKPALIKQAQTADSGYTYGDRDATFVSYINAHLKQASAEEMQTAADYARFWNIVPECQAAMAKLAAYTPPETPDSAFALCVEHNGEVVRKYAAFNSDSTRDAAIAFFDNRTRYPLSWRTKTAAELLDRAEKHGVSLPAYVDTYLHKAANAGYPTEQSVEDILISRRDRVKVAHAAEVERLTELFHALASEPSLQLNSRFVKQAMDCLENFDVACGLTDEYDNGMPLPEEVIADNNVLPELQKVASASLVELINGTVMDVRSLTKTALAAVGAKLEKLSHAELVEILPTLPREDADLLVRLA